MNRTEARQAIAAIPQTDAAAAFNVGLDLLRNDHAEILLPIARKLARKFPRDPRMQQLLGLAARTAQDSTLALEAFEQAAKLAPSDPLIAHSHARCALEAGAPAVALFQRAVEMAPTDGHALLGMGAALLHEGRAQDAVDHLDILLAANPLWIDGHRDAAHIRGQMGLDPYATITKALAGQPRSLELTTLLAGTHLEALDFEGALAGLQDARGKLGDPASLRILAAHAMSELGNLSEADTTFGTLAPGSSVNDTSLHARHHLRAGRAAKAAALIEPVIARDYDHLLWPYLSLAWRLTENPRYRWLEADERLISVYDLGNILGDLDVLASHLRHLHFASAQPLDQSVRGGTQTDGNLLLRTSAPIRKLRKAILAKVADHVAQLPPFEAGHPTLLKDRDPLRVAGSWSVRLKDEGFHSDHVHSKGWISSALYITLPDTIGQAQDRGKGETDHSGWLTLGESRDILPGLEPVRLVEPKQGRLVLFPSTMWHGTRPFSAGERMTVAFDIARPQQS
ncbi:putative 2OG-Fe(II) oxygenase [Erythrobacter aureus]|uniref:putative 2OG-Fe(II) oxygenase n=1 Tax=Erythrobacter aureus TaxID=2182384 RepID=UPI003A924489